MTGGIIPDTGLRSRLDRSHQGIRQMTSHCYYDTDYLSNFRSDFQTWPWKTGELHRDETERILGDLTRRMSNLASKLG